MAVLTDEEVTKRFESPMNLFHRLRSTTKKESLIVSIPPKSSDIIPDLDRKIDLASSRTKALSIMNKVLTRLDDEVEAIPTDKLPNTLKSIALAAKELQPEDSKVNPVQFVIYTPQLMTEESLGQAIEVTE